MIALAHTTDQRIAELQRDSRMYADKAATATDQASRDQYSEMSDDAYNQAFRLRQISSGRI